MGISRVKKFSSSTCHEAGPSRGSWFFASLAFGSFSGTRLDLEVSYLA